MPKPDKTFVPVPKTLHRKLRRESRRTPEDGFPRMGSVHYLTWLSELQFSRKPDAYFEIGTESGVSLSFASCTSVAVDPLFLLEADVSRNKPQLHQFQCTSDDFFKTGFLEQVGLKFDIAFLDGMHLFEFLLRDFMNIERFMAPDGIIVMHDCVPFNSPSAERIWDKSKTRSWTGDVWKLIPILRKYRKDLAVNVYDLQPSGLVVVGNLDPKNSILRAEYEKIIFEYKELSIKTYGLAKLVHEIDLQPAPKLINEEKVKLTLAGLPKGDSRWEIPEMPAQNHLRIAIKTPHAKQTSEAKIVDYQFVRALADGFLKVGHSVRIDSGQDWYSDPDGTDFDLVIRGRGGFTGQKGIPFVNWVIYPGPEDRHQITDDELTSALHTFFASEIVAEKVKKRLQSASVSTLFQGFDPKYMYSVPNCERTGIVFVGSNHFKKFGGRPIIEMVVNTDTPLRIWGSGWKKHPMSKYLQDNRLSYDLLGDVYRSSETVLCDHMPSMRDEGYISNRIFDALACARPVISDRIDGIPEELQSFVYLCDTDDDFVAALQSIKNEGPEQKNEREILAKQMQFDHSLHVRAADIVVLLLQSLDD